MFTWFSENKANYKKGQIFPFVIAALAMLIIMAMITANLGKIAIFKTDVSNAADSGALAGASILSGYLLGVGLTSDTWCGTAIVTTARMMEIAILGRDDINIPSFSLTGSPSGTSSTTTTNKDGSTTTTTTSTDNTNTTTTTTTTTDTNGDTTTKTSNDGATNSYQNFAPTLVGMIKLYVQHLLKFYLAYPTILSDSIMTWSNAKQTALRVAFQNSGVDERPNTSFKEYGGDYDSYVNDYLSQEANQTGFTRFMSHTISGYGYPLGEITPYKVSDTMVTSGYGWTQNADETFSGSYPGNDYQSKENWVQVIVQGSVMYPIEALSFADYFGTEAVTTLTAIVGVGSYLKYIGLMGGSGDTTVKKLIPKYGLGYLLAAIFAIVTALVFRGMVEYLPSGLKFQDDNNALYTTQNPIVVQVKRHKRPHNLGMWNFQYGDVTSVSGAHAFPDNEDATIKPVFVESITSLGSSSGNVNEENWSSPDDIITIAQGAFCMGLTFSVAGSILTTCSMLEQECAENYIELAVVSYLTGNVPVALEFLAWGLLCSDNTDSLNPQSGDATMNTSGFLALDTSEWFDTYLHLFETELYQGYVG
jgi:hypothetical protein